MTNRWASCFGRALCRTKNFEAAERVASLNLGLRRNPTPGARGSRTLAVIVQSKLIAVTDGGPDRFTVADAPEIVRRSMARANHSGPFVEAFTRGEPKHCSQTKLEAAISCRLLPLCFPESAMETGLVFPNVITTCILKAFWSGRRDSNPRPQPWQGSCPFVLN